MFAVTVFMSQYTGGQVAIIARKLAGDVHGGHKCWKELIQHYESPGNKTIAVTQITTNMQKLRYTNRSNFGLNAHLTKFQGYLQDLDDIEITQTTSAGTVVNTTANLMRFKLRAFWLHPSHTQLFYPC